MSSDGQLGWIVSWKVPQEIGLHELRHALQQNGFDPNMIAPLHNENALKRAFREMSKERVIRKLRVEGDIVFFQFTHEYITSHAANYTREAELQLDRNNGVVTGDDAGLVAEAQKLLQEHMAKRITSDLTRLVQKVFDSAKADLVPIRDEGFAYFVPQQHSALVYKAAGLLADIGGKLSQFAIRMGSGPTDASITETMATHMLQLVADFRQSCAELSADTRLDVRSRRMNAISDLRDKLNCYQSLLVGVSDQIRNEIDVADREMMQALVTREAVPA